MANPVIKAQVLEKFDKATKLRESGNEKFKVDDAKGALNLYYQSLLYLKGLDQSILQAFPTKSKPINEPSTKDEDKIKELTAEEEEELKESGDKGKEKEPELSEEAKAAEEGENLQKDVKKTIGLLYTNMAACHIKEQNWKKALEFAQNATTADHTNSKALFREAQARIGLGEVTRGRQILQDLQKTKKDPAVSAALEKLEAEEKIRIEKNKAQFKGMFDSGSKEADLRFKEIIDEDTGATK